MSVWVLIPTILGGGEVIADALVSGTRGIDSTDDDGSIAGAGVRALHAVNITKLRIRVIMVIFINSAG